MSSLAPKLPVTLLSLGCTPGSEKIGGQAEELGRGYHLTMYFFIIISAESKNGNLLTLGITFIP